LRLNSRVKNIVLAPKAVTAQATDAAMTACKIGPKPIKKLYTFINYLF